MSDVRVAPGLPEAALIDLLFAIVVTLGGFLLLRSARRSTNQNWDGSVSQRLRRARRWDIAVAVLLFLLGVDTSQANRSDSSGTFEPEPVHIEMGTNVDYPAATRDWITAIWRRAPNGSPLKAGMERCRTSEECIEAATRTFHGACGVLASEGTPAAVREAFTEAVAGVGLTAGFEPDDAEIMADELADAARRWC